MRSVGLKVLKNKLSEYVRLAAGGETILVTDRDRVVAEILPPQPGHSIISEDALRAEGVREGWLTPAALKGQKLPPRKPTTTLRQILKELDNDRADRGFISTVRLCLPTCSLRIARCRVPFGGSL
jgi:antitoxin (DNA-binding transcriptional repressor) of toxin-antitoxin stability system